MKKIQETWRVNKATFIELKIVQLIKEAPDSLISTLSLSISFSYLLIFGTFEETIRISLTNWLTKAYENSQEEEEEAVPSITGWKEKVILSSSSVSLFDTGMIFDHHRQGL